MSAVGESVCLVDAAGSSSEWDTRPADGSDLSVGDRALPLDEMVPMTLRDAALELAWPTRCIGCDEPGTLLCAACRERLAWIEQRHACPNCGAPFGALTCTECDLPKGDAWETRSVVCALPLAGLARRLVVTHKDRGERRLASVIAAALVCALDEASGWLAPDGAPRFDAHATDAVCFVPATAAAFRRRGFDHMEPIARTLAGFVGLPFVDALARGRARDQRRLGKHERAANASGATEVVCDVSGMSLLLVDDVVTTGATTRACAQALLGRGATEVTACALARTF